jgi:DNA-binding SARP family transcriptional activator
VWSCARNKRLLQGHPAVARSHRASYFSDENDSEFVRKSSLPTGSESRAGGETSHLGVVRVNVLGPFQIEHNTRTIDVSDWPRRKAAHLFKLLTISPGHRLQRDQVIDALWPEQRISAGANNLRVTLHAARTVIRERLDIDGLIVSTGDLLSIQWPGGLVIDLDEFETLARHAQESGSDDAFLQAIAIYQELLPEDRYEEWTLQKRDELETRFSGLCLAAAQHAEHSGDYARGIQILNEAIGRVPMFEAAHAALIRLLALSGRTSDALRHFEGLRIEFEREDFEPGPEILQLAREIESGQFRATQRMLSEQDPIVQRPEAGSRAGLPSMLTRFVGRRDEKAHLTGLLENSRLVTIRGIGGCGKTRLALEVASQVQETFDGNACMVELAPFVERSACCAIAGDSAGGSRTTKWPPDRCHDQRYS